MLKKSALAFLAASVALAAQAHAADTSMRDRCVQLHMIDESLAIDDKTIVIRLRGNAGYKRVDLVNRCPGLKMSNGFAHSTSTGDLCDRDTVRPLEPAASSCGIAKIVNIDEREGKALIASR